MQCNYAAVLNLLTCCIHKQSAQFLIACILLQIFPTKDHSTFPDALAEVSKLDVFRNNLPSAAAFACAGPVANNKCEMTNLSWVVDGDYLSHTHGIRYMIWLLSYKDRVSRR